MGQYLFEFSKSLIPSFAVEVSKDVHSRPFSDFELSMMCGVMVHPASSFSIDDAGESLSIEWAQDYPI